MDRVDNFLQSLSRDQAEELEQILKNDIEGDISYFVYRIEKVLHDEEL